MKFILGFLPTLPVTMAERLRERPIGYRTEYWQRMLDQIVEIARVAEDVGFDMASFTEHHLHTEGLEIGSVPSLSLYTAMHTKHLKVGTDRIRAARVGTRCAWQWKSAGSTR